jgi:hypothetical protein
MYAKAQQTGSDLPINIGKKTKRKTSRASFAHQDEAHEKQPRVMDIIANLKAMNVIIPMIPEVSEYLNVHSDLSLLILPICSKLRKTFPAAATLSLEVYRDPEISDKYLTLCIRTNEDHEKILDGIDEAMAEFEPMLGSASGWLLVTADFLLPK